MKNYDKGKTELNYLIRIMQVCLAYNQLCVTRADYVYHTPC